MNNKGFTLIELLVTILLLSIISIISFVSINGVVKESRINDCKNLVNNIKSAAKEYVSDNRYNSDFDSDNDKKIKILGSDLISGKYLSSPITNPFDGDVDITSSLKVEVELKNDYTPKDITVMNDETPINCDEEKW